MPRSPRKAEARCAYPCEPCAIGAQHRLRKLLPGRPLCSGPVQNPLASDRTLVEGAMVQHYLEALGPALLIAAFFLILVLNWPRRRTWSRAITCAFVLAVSLRYLWWRFHDTVLPYPNDDGTFYWVWFLFVVELLGFTEIVLFLLTMGRYADRGAEADRLQAAFAAQPQDEWPTVDVFIPTYDEPIDVLERAIVGALALDYPRHKLKVYVLDDKRRDWLRKYCEEQGAVHVTRPDNLHAKAGNLNHGLKLSRGGFVAVFDADFVPYRNFFAARCRSSATPPSASCRPRSTSSTRTRFSRT